MVSRRALISAERTDVQLVVQQAAKWVELKGDLMDVRKAVKWAAVKVY